MRLFFVGRFLFVMLLGIPGSLFAQQSAGSKIPVTNLPYNDDTAKLQFAIISDLWGGRRPGIFEDAVSKLQLLQPQLVLSVGDLIDGKSYEPSEIEKQWNEFDAAIKPLNMPFFYVPGNHDISNTVMEQEWIKRMGSPYYHFIYRNVLFLCINTEDGGRGGIREGQINYFKKVIEENTQVRWTFLFMHRPVWQGKGDRQEGYEKIEAFLKGRNYTLFSGHHHTYLNLRKNGQKHFVLGSTGGGSDLRGEKFGEFDHITLVTLTKGEPTVVNLKLEGIIPEDIVNERTHPITETLIDQNWLIPVANVSERQQENAVNAEVILNNPTNYPLRVFGKLDEQAGCRLSPSEWELTVAPQSKITKQVTISRADGSMVDLANLSAVNITLNGEYVYDGFTYNIPATKKLLLSWKLIPGVRKSGADTSGMIALTNPEYLNGPWYWSGAADGLLQFKMTTDEKFAYITVLVNDDQWVNEKDIIQLYLEDVNGEQNLVSFTPWDKQFKIEGKGAITAKDIVSKKNFSNGRLLAELKIPLTKILKKDSTIRMNIGFCDEDATPEKTTSTLFWKPLWGTPGDYTNSGTFLIK